ncbi:Hypothetical protein SSCIU_02578 [Mammaliicoccus sciuri]|nr:Hypothetical protein SSCIU_02578 [Mammaliicoccus sciuri]
MSNQSYKRDMKQ